MIKTGKHCSRALSSFCIIVIPCLTCQFMVPADVTGAETHPRASRLPEVQPRATFLFLPYLLTIVSQAWTDH